MFVIYEKWIYLEVSKLNRYKGKIILQKRFDRIVYGPKISLEAYLFQVVMDPFSVSYLFVLSCHISLSLLYSSLFLLLRFWRRPNSNLRVTQSSKYTARPINQDRFLVMPKSLNSAPLPSRQKLLSTREDGVFYLYLESFDN